MKVLNTLLQTAIESGTESDRNAFWTALYDASSVKLSARLRSRYKHLTPSESLDFVHNAFEKLMAKDLSYFERYFEKGDNKMEGLLWRTTYHLYLNHSKKEKTSPKSLELDEHTLNSPVYQPPYDGDIARLLEQIGEKERSAFVLFVYDGYGQQEIADMEMEKTSLSAIKMRIVRAKNSLKKAFEADS